MKVAIFEPIGGYGGLEFYDMGLCRAVASRGMDVTLYTCRRTQLHDLQINPYRIERIFGKVFESGNKLIKGARYVSGMIRSQIHAKRKGSQIAHFHLFHFSGLEYFNLRLARRFGFRVVATVHDIESLHHTGAGIQNEKYLKFLKVIDRVIVHNRFTKTELTGRLPGIDEQMIHIIPPTDLDPVFERNIPRSGARKALGLDLPEDSKIILFFGKIKETKGLDILIRAFAGIKMKNVFLIIAGRSWKSDLQKFIDLIETLDLKERVILRLEYIKNSDLPYFFRAADIVALPYRKVYNSSVLLRALDYGTTPVVSDLAVFREMVTDRYNGLIFKKDDIKDLARVFSDALDDDELRDRIEKNGEEYIRENYSLEKIGEKTESVYREVVQ